MLLESLKLKNFRQFRDESIDFALGDDGKNVTIIIGENGTGKTTFAQAFFWCMYGETEFTDKIMLNRKAASEMKPNSTETVEVTLKLRHGSVCYTMTREQTYRKDYSGKLKGDNTVFNIEKKDETGKTMPVKKVLCDSEVQSILPKELSRYFFFDGERIEKMSKDIQTGKKASDFADAVKGLLGLNGMFSAIQHFNPKSKSSVIGKYDSSYDATSNEQIAEYTAVINECKTRIEEIDAEIESLDSQIEIARARKAEKTAEIKQYSEGEKLQKEKESLETSIKRAERSRANMIKSISSLFNSNMSSFFSLMPMQRSLELLVDKDFTGKDIPSVNDKTIDYLLERKICLCGTHLDEGSTPYLKVQALKEFIPPQHIGTEIGNFKVEAKRRANNTQDLYQGISDLLASVGALDDEISEHLEEIRAIDKKLSGDDVREKVRQINTEIGVCEKTIKSCGDKRDKDLVEKGELTQRMERADTERHNLSLLDDKNKKIELYKAYAERIYEKLVETYGASEQEIRAKLEQTINDIFLKIYDGGLSLTIDEKYHITVYVNDYEVDTDDAGVEASTAQSIAVIFAFITGVIQMARENRNSMDANAKLLSSEPYPLVMDAPLSAFDKRRIKTVCETLPVTAEQVVIFIKDTDGELAEKHMGAYIGSRHQFVKLNEFETVLE